jgi:5-methylthioadenosine/S-adenosylhomocysteine deaminase
MALTTLGGLKTPLKSGQDRLFEHLVLIAPGSGVFQDASLLVSADGEISQFGPKDQINCDSNTQRVDARGFLVAPGLINAHTHAPLAFFRGQGHGKTNMIETFLFPAEKSLTPELLEPLSYSYIAGGLKAGVTTFGDHYYMIEGVGKALDRLGMRGFIGETLADLGGAFPDKKTLSSFKKLLEKWPFSDRIKPVMAPHAADTVSKDYLQEIASFAKTEKLPLHMHLSQTAGERQRVTKREGQSPVAYADQCGALFDQTLAVHLVSVDENDLKILAERGVTVGGCPTSQIIYENLAPIEGFVRHHLPIALATDCAASHDSADMLAELKLFNLLAADRGLGPQDPLKSLDLVTKNAAKVFGADSYLGGIFKGAQADLVFMDIGLETLPMENPEVNFIYSMSTRNVAHVMVGGDFVLWNGELTKANEEDLKEQYTKACADIKSRIQG